MNRRPRILLGAFYWSPYRGGEAAVGWNFSRQLAADHDVTVLCGDFTGEGRVAAELAQLEREGGFPPGLEVVEVAMNARMRLFHGLHTLPGMWFLYYRAYREWQRAALARARVLHAIQPFDLAHQLTIITCREPGLLWQLGIPWFWGPINGAALMPWKFLPSFGAAGRYRHASRNILNWLQTRFSRNCRQAARHAGKIWTVTAEDRALVERGWGCRAEPMLETGAAVRNLPPKALAPGEPVRLAWSGIIEARKALPLVLRALAAIGPGTNWELQIIGDGPEREPCRALAGELRLGDRIAWHGRVEHARAMDLLAGCHALVHSSLKEGTPHVVLEALSFGLPVVCHDCCGMGLAVDERCGIKVPLADPPTSIAGFAAAIRRLGEGGADYGDLSAGALARARELSWEAKIRAIAAEYQAALAPSCR
jgi:glycosyltransferase involved in cell wall biosynthesis